MLYPVNVVALVGQLARPARVRVLPSGQSTVELDVTVPGSTAETANVVLPEGPDSVATLAAGTEVVVVGRVRRRFFRAAGSTQSRTEVVAAEVVPCRRAKRASKVLEEAASRVLEAAGPP